MSSKNILNTDIFSAHKRPTFSAEYKNKTIHVVLNNPEVGYSTITDKTSIDILPGIYVATITKPLKYSLQIQLFDKKLSRTTLTIAKGNTTSTAVKTINRSINVLLVIDYIKGLIDDEIFSLQLESGILPTPYAPYLPDLGGIEVTRDRPDGADAQTYLSEPYGIVKGMTSLSPSMRITSDNPGALITASYYSKGAETK